MIPTTSPTLVLGALVLSLACSQPSPPSVRPSASPGPEEPVWHYDGPAGPEHWAELSNRFVTCRDGRQQSPIDITLPVPGGVLPALRLQFPPAALRIAHHEHVADGINNGHTVQISYDDGDTLMLGDAAYELVQYHFHSPSEHTFSGRPFPMEMHMVHRASSGALAVVSVFIEQGRHNPAFDPIWANLPTEKGVEKHYEHVTVDVDELLPATHASYRYEGSLTTPPCTESVQWILLATPITLDTSQIHMITRLIGDNSRPVQALHGRPVVADMVQ
jgi:carbonic anhydrase